MKKILTLTQHFRTRSMGLVAVFALAFMVVLPQASAQTATTQFTQTITRSLVFGSSGNDVTTLQQFLSGDSNIYPEKLVTGYYGQLTGRAVSNFQSYFGLPAVGRVGPLTRDKINSLISSGSGLDIKSPLISGVRVTLSGGTVFTSGSSVTTSTSTTSTTSTSTSSSTSTVTSTTAPTSNSVAVISWNTSETATGKVYYATSPLRITEGDDLRQSNMTVSGTMLSVDTQGISQSAVIPNLQPGTTYYYVIVAIDRAGNISNTFANNSFTTNR